MRLWITITTSAPDPMVTIGANSLRFWSHVGAALHVSVLVVTDQS